MGASLDCKVQDAVIGWIANVAVHEQNVGIVARRFEQAKFTPLGDLDPLTLPAIIVKATQEQQVHSKVACWRFGVEIVLSVQADDANKAAWDGYCSKLETIFMADDLKGYLNASGDHLYVAGIVSRNLGSKRPMLRHWERTFSLVLFASHAV